MEKAEIRENLKNSLDMVRVHMYLFCAGIILLVEGVMVLLLATRPPFGPSRWLIFGIMAVISVVPILVFCLWRTISIFRCPESYHFCISKSFVGSSRTRTFEGVAKSFASISLLRSPPESIAISPII